MDFKHKGISWVGNVYQKFEAVCHEVDNIISQDTVKYVEHQVNSASKSVKKLYSNVVQDLLPPIVDPVKYESQAVAQGVAFNAYFKSPTCNKENAENSVANKSSVGFGANGLMDNQPSQASCKLTIENEEDALVASHSLLELIADFHVGKNDDILIDKDLDERIKENVMNESLGNSDGTLTDKHAFMESEAVDPFKNLLRSVSTNIDFTNKIATFVYDDSDLQLEDDVLSGKNDGGMTDKHANESSERDATMEIDPTDPLKHGPDRAFSQMESTNEEANSVFDYNSHLPLEYSILTRKNDDVSSKEDVIMEPDASDLLKNHPSHPCSGTNVNGEEAALLSDDSHLLLESEVILEKNDKASIDKDLNKSFIRDSIFELDATSYFPNLPSHGCKGISFTNKEAIVVSVGNHLRLETELLSGKNGDALADKISNESLRNETFMENDTSYPLKHQPRCTSSRNNYQKEEVTSVSNDSLLKLESELFVEKNNEALMDRETDASLNEWANLEFSTELTLCCDKESVKGSLYSEFYDNKEDIVTLTGDLQATSVGSADVGSTHKVGQDSSILVNSLINFSPQMKLTSDYFTNETRDSSNTPDPPSELDPLALTCVKIVKELRSASSFKPPANISFFPSMNSVENFSSSTVVHDKPVDPCVSVKTHQSFDMVTCASCENESLEMRHATSRSSLSSMQPPEDHVSKARGSAFLPELCTSSHIQFRESTSSEALIFSEVGCSYDSCGYISDADMETVDLRDHVAPIDSCDIMDYRALHAVSRRTQKLCSYKKRIQDAFTSRRRLAKEYEQLAIWYGDTDLEFSTDSSQKLPFSAQTPMDSKNVSTSYASDSEWELL